MNNQPLNIKDLFFKIFEFYFFLKKNVILLISFTLIGTLIGFFLDWQQKHKVEYEAEIKFLLETESSGDASDVSALASSLGFGGGSSSNNLFSGENFKELLKTDVVVRKALLNKATWGNDTDYLINLVFKYGNLKQIPYFSSQSDEFFAMRYKTHHVDSLTYPEKFTIKYVGDYMKGLTTIANVSTKSSLQSIEVVSHSDTLSNIWAHEYLKSISDYYVASKTKKTSELVKIMKSRVDSLKAALYYTQGKLAQFSDQNQQIILQSARVTAERLQLNSSQIQQLYSEAVRSYDNLKFSLVKETPLLNVIYESDFPSIPPIKTLGKITALGAIIGLFSSLVVMYFISIIKDFQEKERRK